MQDKPEQANRDNPEDTNAFHTHSPHHCLLLIIPFKPEDQQDSDAKTLAETAFLVQHSNHIFSIFS
jgi:hypothetical protein